MNYHYIDDIQVEDVQSTQINIRAIQNEKATYNCVKTSIRGDIEDTIFSQFDNLPMAEDGNDLFKKITTFTTVSSLQLSMLSFNDITNFEYNTPVINSKLIHLFVLATNSTRQLLESERIQHILNAYGKILQPEVWAQWFRAKIDAFEEGTIKKSQDFMNTATIKYNKIIGKDGKFSGSMTCVQDDIVSIFAIRSKKRKATSPSKTLNEERKPHSDNRDLFLFFTHYQDKDSKKYKLRDSKDYNGNTHFFCDSPLHRNRLKMHTHNPEKIRTRERWLKKKTREVSNNDAKANIGK